MKWHYGSCVRGAGVACVTDYDRHIHPAKVVIGFDILAALNSGRCTADEALLQFDCIEWSDPSLSEALAEVGKDEA